MSDSHEEQEKVKERRGRRGDRYRGQGRTGRRILQVMKANQRECRRRTWKECDGKESTLSKHVETTSTEGMIAWRQIHETMAS